MRWRKEDISQFIPSPANGYALDWDQLGELFPVLAKLERVPQDPEYHKEGDVLTHTRMVVECLTDDPEWRQLPDTDRAELWLGTLLHDIGKLKTTEIRDDGRISSRNHTAIGARMGRELIWMHPELSIPFPSRERIAGYIRHHGLPVWVLEKKDPVQIVRLTSQLISMQQLYLLSRNDMKGRISSGIKQKLESVDLFRDFCREQHCLDTPFPFADDVTRFLYAKNGKRDPSSPAYDDSKMEVILLSGLPAAGKDTWIHRHGGNMEVVSLDTLRQAMGVDPAGNQGRVVQAAHKQARKYLAKGTPFIWNATNVTRQLRDPLITLFRQYKARVRLVYVECPYRELFRRNAERPDPVPETVIRKLIQKLEVPEPFEAHRVDYVVES